MAFKNFTDNFLCVFPVENGPYTRSQLKIACLPDRFVYIPSFNGLLKFSCTKKATGFQGNCERFILPRAPGTEFFR